MTTGFLTYNGESRLVDVDDLLVRREFFSDGGLYAWGNNGSRTFGDNTTSDRSSPVIAAGGGTNWKQVSCGGEHTSAIKSDGTLWVWGDNSRGMLGDNTTSARSSPVTTAGGGTNWKQAACARLHTAGIKTDGSLWNWGADGYGVLGQGSLTLSKISPVTTAGGGFNWKQVACGYRQTLAVKTDGTLWMWGFQNSVAPALGDGSGGNKSSPVTTTGGGTNWKQGSCGGNQASICFTAAVKTDGTLWTWGSNYYGQLGNGSPTGSSAGASKNSPTTTAGGGTNWKQVSCGGGHMAAIKTDGILWTWGSGTGGELGDGTAVNKNSPVTTAGGGTNWKQVSCSQDFMTAAIKTDGTLWTWGVNQSGALGDNTISSRSSPVSVVGGIINWKQVTAGGGAGTLGGGAEVLALTDLSL